MADIAQLGIQVSSQGLDKAISELRLLEQIGSRAGAVANALQGQTRSAARGLEDMERATQRAHASLGRFIGLSAGAAFGAFTAGLVKAKNEILELAKVAEDNRLRPELVSGLFSAAGAAGASQSEIKKALEQFSDVSKKARDDAEAFYKAMSNISPALARAFQTAPTQEERLRLVSEALRTTTDEVKRLQLAQEAFGTDSERVLRVLGAGRDAISEYERAARAMGLAVDQDMITKARQADQVLAQLSNVVSANLRAALVEIAPVIANVAAQLGPLATEALRIISALTGAQGLATTSTLRTRRDGGESDITRLQGEAARLEESRRYADTQEVDRINARIQEIRKTIRDVDAELANRGEYADPRDLRGQANERFRLSGGLAGAPRSFRERPNLTPRGGGNDDQESSAARALRQLEERNALARQELATIGQSTEQREAALAYERALNVAKRDGKPLTDEQLQQLREQSDEYGRIAAAIKKAREAQRQLKELQDFAKGTFSSFFQDIGQGLSQGKNLWESFAQAGLNALNRIAQKLIDMAAQQLFMSAFGGSGGFGSILGSLLGGGGGGSTMTAILAKGGVFANDNLVPFAKGGAFTNSIVTQPTVFPFAKGVGLMGEAGPEAIMPLRRTADGRLGVAGMGGGNTTFAPVTNITVQGNADANTVATLKAELDRRDRAMEAKIPGIVSQARRDRTLKSA